MKAPILLISIGFLVPPLQAADEAGDAVAAIGLLPSQRTGQHVTAQERNPFAAKPKEVAKVTQQEDTETQESRIRAIFRAVTVTGVRRDKDGSLLGLAADLILRQGDRVNPVLEEQTEVLVVSKIEPKQIELTFVEDKDSTQPRTIVLPVRNKVEVRQKLFAQTKGERKFFVANTRKALAAGEAAGLAAAMPSVGASDGPASKWPPLASAAAAAGGNPASSSPRDPRVPSPDGPPPQLASSEVAGTHPDGIGEGPAVTPPAPGASSENPQAPAPAPAPEAGPTPATAGETAPSSETAPVPSAPVPMPAPAPVSRPAPIVTPVAAPAAPAQTAAMVSPPTFMRRHRDRPTAEPEGAKTATPPPTGSGGGVVE